MERIIIKMNVKELIKELGKENPETDIIIDGYEGGFDDMNSICKIKIINNVNTPHWYGKHEEAPENEPYDREVILFR